MIEISNKLYSWASDIDEGTIEQALTASRLEVITGHIALMPDAHVGIGATVGSVIPTQNAIIPSAVGVDIGCGMIAVETSIKDEQLPDNIDKILPIIEHNIPAGVGQGHTRISTRADQWMLDHKPPSDLTGKQVKTALEQFGTLGSGNHFFEICLDERNIVWIVLHSGSRGIGNQLASGHIKKAKELARHEDRYLEDAALAYFLESDIGFWHYISDLLWAQAYALGNRNAMMDNSLSDIFSFFGVGKEVSRINCHHNFTQKEYHGDKDIWITRKGAIKAAIGDLGIIPGSMGTRSYIVRGLGNPASYNSCSHGAGRRYSRKKAKELFTVDDLAQQMKGKVWLDTKAQALLDEIPSCYKNIDRVMDDQSDLVEIVHTLYQIVNYKGC